MSRRIGFKKVSLALAILVVVSFVLLSGCASLSGGVNPTQSTEKGVPPSYPAYNAGGTDSSSGYVSYPAPMPTGTPGSAYTDVSERKVIMTGSVSLETSDVDKVVDNVRSVASGAGGYVSSSSSYLTSQNKKQATVSIRVPSDKYESCYAQIKALGRVKSESSSGSDVTMQYIDLSARLKNLQAEEKSLNEIMALSKNVTETLSVEKELFRVRGDIESTQQQLNYLGSQVDFSTITVSVAEPEPVVGYDWGLDTAFAQAAHAFIGMIGALIILTGYLIPLVLYLVLALVVLYLVIRAALWLYKKWKGGKIKESKP